MRISVYSEKGGAGKSTLAVALAFAFDLPIIDLDPMGVSSGHLRLRDATKLRQDGWIADFPAGTDLTHTQYLRDADLVIVPCRPTYPDLKGLGQTLRFVKAHAGPSTRMCLFANAIAPKSSDLNLFVEAVGKHGLPILGHFTQRVAYGRAGVTGRPFGDLDPIAGQEVESVVESVKGVLEL